MRRDDGFTLLEVLIAMLLGTIGLLGTMAVQQAIISASKNANDAAVAMRLASQKIEELASRNTDNEVADLSSGLKRIATDLGQPTVWWPKNAALIQVPEHVDAEGMALLDSDGKPIPPQPGDLGRYRWRRQWKVVSTGSGLPYVISVIVTYNNDAGDPKTIRLDLERRKSW